MASKPYEIRWTKVKPGMQIAVSPRHGFAWQLGDVEQHPDRYEWRTVVGKDEHGPLIDLGGRGVNGPNVVVRDR